MPASEQLSTAVYEPMYPVTPVSRISDTSATSTKVNPPSGMQQVTRRHWRPVSPNTGSQRSPASSRITIDFHLWEIRHHAVAVSH